MTRKIKIVILLPWYFEEMMGGAELQAKFLAQQLTNEKQYRVYYIFTSSMSAFFANPMGLTLVPISRKFLYEKMGGINYPYALSFWHALKQIKPDIIYNRNCNALTAVGSFYAKNNNCRMILHVSSDQQVAKTRPAWLRPYLIPEIKLAQYGIQHAEKIIVQTAFQAEELQKNYRRDACVIPNAHPVPADCIKDRPDIQVLWIANFKPVKQPEMFIQLAEQLVRLPHVKCTMLGRTDRYETIVSRAEQIGVNVMGEVPNETVNDLLARGHILVNTSLVEGFSNTFIQAWMRSVPVVSLQVNPDHILTKEEIGFCSGSLPQLIEDTRKLITDDTLRHQMGARARTYSTKNYSMNNINRIIQLAYALNPR